ncbi:hypothetical protein D3C72_1409160 [compost metagenome]
MVYARGVSPTGTPSAATYSAVATIDARPAIACNPTTGELLLAWNSSVLAFSATKLTQDAAGDLTDSLLSTLLTGLNLGQNPAVAYNRNADEYLLAFTRHNGTDQDVYAHTLSGNLLTLANPTQLIAGGPGNQIAPAVASQSRHGALANVTSLPTNDKEFLVAWEDHQAGDAIRARRVPSGPAPTPYTAQLIAMGNGSFRPRVDYMPSVKNAANQYLDNADHYLVAWEQPNGEASSVRVRRVSAGVNQPLDNRGELTLYEGAGANGEAAVWADPAHADYVVVWQQAGVAVQRSIVP